jgi:hypothetical protein
MARGGHELPKVSTGFAKTYPSTPYRQATPEMALIIWPSSTPWTPHAKRLWIGEGQRGEYEEEIFHSLAWTYGKGWPWTP